MGVSFARASHATLAEGLNEHARVAAESGWPATAGHMRPARGEPERLGYLGFAWCCLCPLLLTTLLNSEDTKVSKLTARADSAAYVLL